MPSPLFDAVSLEGENVRLEPLNRNHKTGLTDAINDGRLWELFVTLVPHPSQLDYFFDQAEKDFANGDGLAFAIIDKKTQRIAGSTRFMKASAADKKTEIGFTFIGKSWQKTLLNTECKWLLLTHAFEVLNLSRVEFLTDYLNNTSRNAILRLGAKQEGILRNHRVMPNGRIRDTIIFSIIKNEWKGVEEHLMFKLGQVR
jgi:RimJ/RimL family protein N-acetyltransferase